MAYPLTPLVIQPDGQVLAGDRQPGQVYVAKVSGKLTTVRVDRENPRGGWDGTNLSTKKPVRIKSPQRLRAKATKKMTPAEAQAVHAAAQVLAEAGEPLNTKEMVERMLAKGLWTTGGKTPAATIYSAIIREINTKGADARFRKVARGTFELTQ